MPNEAKHTPGPWEVNGQTIETVARPSLCIGLAFVPDELSAAPESMSECEANACLIAAAPEGYELARYIKHLGDEGHSINEKAYRMARALIAKVNNMTDSDLDRIEAYCAKATAGPWIIADSEIVAIKAIDADIEVCAVGFETDERVMGDAQFIKRARADLPALVKELRVARQEAQQARDMALEEIHKVVREFYCVSYLRENAEAGMQRLRKLSTRLSPSSKPRRPRNGLPLGQP